MVLPVGPILALLLLLAQSVRSRSSTSNVSR
jgi:hypothetical protein